MLLDELIKEVGVSDSIHEFFVRTVIRQCTFIEETGCLEWDKYRDNNGYGKITFRSTKYLTHRVIAYKGDLYKADTDTLKALHKCDNPSCCRFEHLFLGTQRDNLYDAVSKGRLVLGSGPRSRSLTDEQAREVKHLLAEGLCASQIRRRLGVKTSTVADIAAHRSYKDVV